MIINDVNSLMRWQNEEYPIGADLVTLFIGRDSNGNGIFTANTTIDSSGDYVSTSASQGASNKYMEINPDYRYKKTKDGRLYVLAWYDSDYNFISRITSGYSTLTELTLPAPPSNARYARMATHSARSNWKIGIIRIE